MLLAFPSLVLPSVASDTSQMVVIFALLAALLVFFEYQGRCPSIIEFRFAPPYNRLKFGFVAVTIVMMSVVTRHLDDPGNWSMLLMRVGQSIGQTLDFPYSPVRLVLYLLPAQADPQTTELLRIYAGVCYGMSLLMIVCFAALVRLWGWPVRRGAFNVWLNLPLFDPTGGGDVVEKLNREASVNISLGFLMPFLLPAVVLFASKVFDQFGMIGPQTLIWVTCAWAFVPASMIMRGIAVNRIAELITAKRRRAYARAADADARDGLQTV
ncbi:hypothetical protein D6850_15590 [Roseovarius spongiae]|uniref:Uncharacterized protein n=2 Tax=Roseovarius spongiae TaxID=2320272 RepID=A0A3A8AR45_9RHOB|nr:hypothetical protein D6850_15590 [Roseovarius spongiae]